MLVYDSLEWLWIGKPRTDQEHLLCKKYWKITWGKKTNGIPDKVATKIVTLFELFF